MDETLRRNLRHVRELASHLEFDASTYSIDLYSDVPDAFQSSFWQLNLLVGHLKDVFEEQPGLGPKLPAGKILLPFWRRMRRCPDAIDPRLVWVAITVHVADLKEQLEVAISALPESEVLS